MPSLSQHAQMIQTCQLMTINTRVTDIEKGLSCHILLRKPQNAIRLTRRKDTKCVNI
jgi:hypothetical protein